MSIATVQARTVEGFCGVIWTVVFVLQGILGCTRSIRAGMKPEISPMRETLLRCKGSSRATARHGRHCWYAVCKPTGSCKDGSEPHTVEIGWPDVSLYVYSLSHQSSGSYDRNDQLLRERYRVLYMCRMYTRARSSICLCVTSTRSHHTYIP
ncbi:hypothetical protein BDW22DRAFT_538598 [Trametopsis cervina]|nr:hypothetical protein BDW22DRAFT_538598 [Trametopsis cervina]